jgi:hypothetical protein
MGQYWNGERSIYAKELNGMQALIQDVFFTLFSKFNTNFKNAISLDYDSQTKLKIYNNNTYFTSKLNSNLSILSQKCVEYRNSKFNVDSNSLKCLGEYINHLKSIRNYYNEYNYPKEYKTPINQAISIFENIKSIIKKRSKSTNKVYNSKMEIEYDNNSNIDNNNQTNFGIYNTQLMKSKQKEERMMAGDNIGRMLSTAEGLVNICNNKELFNKYQNYDFFDSRKVKTENEIMEQLMSQIEFAEINYSLYLKDYNQPFPFDEENNLTIICKDIDDMKRKIPNKYKYLYTGMKNLLLRKDNSEFLKMVENYDNEHQQEAKIDPMKIGAFGVPIVNYHEEKKEMSNKETGNTYKFDINGPKDTYKDIISAQGMTNVEIMKENVNGFSNK